MNSRFEYLYRDASNFKRWGEIVFAGCADEALIARLRAALHDGEWFIASQLRVPELFFVEYPLDQDDHCWHEFSGIVATDSAPDHPLERTIQELVEELKRAAAAGWADVDVFVSRRTVRSPTWRRQRFPVTRRPTRRTTQRFTASCLRTGGVRTSCW